MLWIRHHFAADFTMRYACCRVGEYAEATFNSSSVTFEILPPVRPSAGTRYCPGRRYHAIFPIACLGGGQPHPAPRPPHSPPPPPPCRGRQGARRLHARRQRHGVPRPPYRLRNAHESAHNYLSPGLAPLPRYRLPRMPGHRIDCPAARPLVGGAPCALSPPLPQARACRPFVTGRGSGNGRWG